MEVIEYILLRNRGFFHSFIFLDWLRQTFRPLFTQMVDRTMSVFTESLPHFTTKASTLTFKNGTPHVFLWASLSLWWLVVLVLCQRIQSCCFNLQQIWPMSTALTCFQWVILTVLLLSWSVSKSLIAAWLWQGYRYVKNYCHSFSFPTCTLCLFFFSENMKYKTVWTLRNKHYPLWKARWWHFCGS